MISKLMSKAYRLYNNIQDDTKQPMAHAVGCFLGVSVMGNTLTLEFRYRLGSRKSSEKARVSTMNDEDIKI